MHPYREYVNPHLGQMIAQLDMDKHYVRGEGAYLFDDQGNRYLDFIAAYGALPFGFNHDSIWKAIEDIRIDMEPNLVQPSNLDPAGQLARQLINVAPDGLELVTFTNSGAEAVEASIKMARSATGRRSILTTHNSFHGKTLAALSATGNPAYQLAFGAPAPGFDYIPFADPEALEAALTGSPDEYAAFIVEPIQGEGGIIIPPTGYLAKVAEICRSAGVLLIVDEIQTGLGRTGRLFACEAEQVNPDILVLAKALGGGMVPIGAVLSTADAYTEDFGLKHSSTFAANTLACRVGLESLRLLLADNMQLVEHVATVGEQLLTQLKAIEHTHPEIVTVRGRGLMIGVEFKVTRDTFPGTLLGVMAEQEMLTPVLSSYLLNTERLRVAPTLNGKSTIRVEPPLIVTADQCTDAADRIGRAVEAVASGNTARVLMHLTGNSSVRLERVPAAAKRAEPTPSHQPDEGRFAFLVHPVDISNYAEFDRALSVFSTSELERLAARWNDMVRPFVVSSCRITASSGAHAYGEFVGVARTADELMTLPREQMMEEVTEAIELARDRGAGIVGLGAYTGVVTYGGLRVQNLGVPVTTGNSYTVVSGVDSVQHALARLDMKPAECCAAIVGASGAIGRGTAILMAEDMRKLMLVGNPAHPERSTRRLEQVAADLCQHLVSQAGRGIRFAEGTIGAAVMALSPPPPHASSEEFLALASQLADCGSHLHIGTDITRISEADVVVTATSNTEEMVTPDLLKHGAVICDISRPPNVSREVHRVRDDVLVIDGGVIALPGRPDLGWDFGFDQGLAYACMAETMMLALEQRYEHASIGSNLTLDFMLYTRQLASKHGFEMAQLRSFDRPLAREEWDRVYRARRIRA